MQYLKKLEVILDPILAIPGFKEKNMVAVPHTPFSAGPLTTRSENTLLNKRRQTFRGWGMPPQQTVTGLTAANTLL